KNLDGLRDFDKVKRVNDSDPASGHPSVNRLRVFQVRVHTCALIHEPRAQMRCRVLRIAWIIRELPRRYKRWNLHAEPYQVPAMIVEVIGVRHSIAQDERPAWILRVRPPVVALGEVVV